MVNGGLIMTKPNFDTMTRQEIREYILQYREDDDEIEALINKGNPNSPTYKFPQTDEDLQEMAAILKQKLNSIEGKI
jgi:hypothetical protein